MYGVRICSFFTASGEGVDRNGRTWRWDFSERFGPVFMDQRDNPLRVQPGERSPAWQVFDAWYKDMKKERDDVGCCT